MLPLCLSSCSTWCRYTFNDAVAAPDKTASRFWLDLTEEYVSLGHGDTYDLSTRIAKEQYTTSVGDSYTSVNISMIPSLTNQETWVEFTLFETGK